MHKFPSYLMTVIHVFDLIPGASRQNEVITCHTKATVHQIAVSRAGNLDDQYLVFVDSNRDIFCTSLRNGSNFVIHKIGEILKFLFLIEQKTQEKNLEIFVGTQVLSTMWASESNILVGLHDSSYSIWYCPGEASPDPTVIALTKVTSDIT